MSTIDYHNLFSKYQTNMSSCKTLKQILIITDNRGLNGSSFHLTWKIQQKPLQLFNELALKRLIKMEHTLKQEKSFYKYINEYRKQLKKGAIKEAYKGLMEYIMDLRVHFKNKYPDHFVSGSIYYGYMDMTYFSFFPESFKHQKLKIAIVFIHDTLRFEVWLAGINKQVQTKYWKFFKESNWNKYRIPATTKGVDSIIEYILVDTPDFSDLDSLTNQIEEGTLKFIEDVENFLSEQTSKG